MALTYSEEKIGSDGRELLTYGTSDFPIAFFDDDLAVIRVPWHWHDEFEIVIILEGEVKVKIASSEFTLLPGDGYFAGSGVLHSADLLSKTGHQHCLVFSPAIIAQPDSLIWKKYVDPILNNHSLPFIKLSSSVPWQKEILRLADLAWNQGGYEKKNYPIHVRGNLSEVFGLIIDHLALLNNESVYTDRFQKNEMRIKKCLTFIENNHASAITIEDIAGSAGISVSSCLRLFKEVLGTTPIKYLIKYRLEQIADDLKTPSDITISEAAYSHGFSDATYFNRCFKKEYGMTPTEYLCSAARQ